MPKPGLDLARITSDERVGGARTAVSSEAPRRAGVANHNFRRRVTNGCEYYRENFLGTVQLGCAVILLRYL